MVAEWLLTIWDGVFSITGFLCYLCFSLQWPGANKKRPLRVRQSRREEKRKGLICLMFWWLSPLWRRKHNGRGCSQGSITGPLATTPLGKRHTRQESSISRSTHYNLGFTRAAPHPDHSRVPCRASNLEYTLNGFSSFWILIGKFSNIHTLASCMPEKLVSHRKCQVLWPARNIACSFKISCYCMVDINENLYFVVLSDGRTNYTALRSGIS